MLTVSQQGGSVLAPPSSPIRQPSIASAPSQALPPVPDELHLKLLRLLAERPELSQRELSRELGLSLGKTHYCVKALLDKGWVKMGNFRRSNNKLAYAYLLTPEGVRSKAALTREFLAVKEREYERLQREIGDLRNEVNNAQ